MSTKTKTNATPTVRRRTRRTKTRQTAKRLGTPVGLTIRVERGQTVTETSITI